MKLERLIAMLTSLLQNDRIPASWFAEKYDISIRTVYRDIEALESAGIPIVTYPGVNGGISILDTYKIDKKLFTMQDITTLLTSLKSISGSVNDAKINSTLEKIKSLIPEKHSHAIELGTKQLYIDMSPWANNPYVSANMAIMQKALELNQLVRFEYSSRYLVNSSRKVEPHQLVLKQGNWYLRGYCRDKKEFRIFKLSRISDMEIQKEVFEPREFEPEIQDFKDWQNENLLTVELIVDDVIKERTLDFCKPEQLREMPDGKIHVKMPFVESDMGYGVLMGFGHHCEVVSPKHVKEELARRISLLANQYPELINCKYKGDVSIDKNKPL